MRFISGLVIVGLCGTSTFAQSPVPVDSVATVVEIEQLITSHIARLEKDLAEASKFDGLKDKGVREGFGMLCVLGQSLAEHSSKTSSKINGPALRDAALAYDRKGTHEQAATAFKQVQEVLAGNISGDHAELHPWNKLINMHPMMEEINSGNSAILRIVKRPRGKPDEVLPAVSWGLLSIAMKADTHEVKMENDLPKWNSWSDEFRDASVKLAEAIRKKDADEGRKWFDAANATCEKCHEVFQ